MDNYTKGINVEEELKIDCLPFQDLPKDFLWVQVKGGSKMYSLLEYASTYIVADQSHTVMVWSGAGVGLGKAISCAERTKRKFNIEHQVTKLTYKTDEEYWNPKVEGLERIVVKRRIPVIHILLSLEKEFDTTQPGYQSLKGNKFWQLEATGNARSSHKGRGRGRSNQYKGNKHDKSVA